MIMEVCSMIKTLIKNWWLLAFCGVLDAMVSVVYFNHVGHGFHGLKAVVFLGEVTLAAGVCTIAAGIWSSRNRKSWLLMLNGLACSALGLILTFWKGPLAFNTIALLIVVMAISFGIYELATARTLRRLAGVVSVGFALVFLAFIFRWIELEPGSPGQTLLWLGSYFGFSAICMLGLMRNNPTFAPQS